MMNLETKYQSKAAVEKANAELKLWNHLIEHDRYIRRMFPKVQEASKSVYGTLFHVRGENRGEVATMTAVTGTTAFTAAHVVKNFDWTKSQILVQDGSGYNGRISDVLIKGNHNQREEDCAIVSLISRQRLKPISKIADYMDRSRAFMIGYPTIFPNRPNRRQLIMFTPYIESIDPTGLISFEHPDDITYEGLSGGALCNSEGELMGIFTSKEERMILLRWKDPTDSPSPIATRNLLNAISLLPGSPFRVNI